MWERISKKIEFQINGGECTNPEMLRAFLDANHITHYCKIGHEQDWPRFMSTGRNTERLKNVSKEAIPYNDHGRAFKNASRDICYVSQPYSDVEIVKAELVRWAEERGLVVELYDSTHSWYNNGNTMLVALHLPGSRFMIP